MHGELLRGIRWGKLNFVEEHQIIELGILGILFEITRAGNATYCVEDYLRLRYVFSMHPP